MFKRVLSKIITFLRIRPHLNKFLLLLVFRMRCKISLPRIDINFDKNIFVLTYTLALMWCVVPYLILNSAILCEDILRKDSYLKYNRMQNFLELFEKLTSRWIVRIECDENFPSITNKNLLAREKFTSSKKCNKNLFRCERIVRWWFLA